MAKKHPARTGTEHQNALARILRQIAHRHSLWTVFRDFVAMAALMLSNAADRSQAEAREAEYLQIAGRYRREELTLMSEGFAHVVMGLETGHQDFLGSLFMLLEMGDSWKGQFFTPYEICLCMGKMNMTGVQSYIEANGFVRVSDPCVGGGAMIIAAAHAMLDEGINYQQHMHAVAQDIDLTAVHMAYIQFSLLHISAVAIHGNSLANETRSTWRTLAHTMGRWDAKLQRLEHAQAIAEAAELMTQPEAAKSTPAPVTPFVPSEEARRAANDPHAAPKVRRPSQANQISLF